MPVNPPADIQLIGGEMLQWSDVSGDSGRLPVRGEVLTALIGRAVPQDAKVLIAGPHDARLVRLLLDRAQQVTCLIRSVPDGEQLVELDGGRGRLRVICGSVDRLGPGEPFDAIVALDGLDRLTSPDSTTYLWADLLAALAGRLAPEGVLLLSLENELGIHRLSEADLPELRRGDELWGIPQGEDPTCPADAARFEAALAALELRDTRSYAVFARPMTPTALLAVDAVERNISAAGRLDQKLGTVIDAACGQGSGERFLLGDPRRLAATAARGGLAARLAPAWIAVTRRSGAALDLPDVLMADGSENPLWSAVAALDETAPGRWTRRPADDEQPSRAHGRVVRELSRLAGPVPDGTLVEQLVLTGLRRHDLPGVRRLLREFTEWLTKQQTDGMLPGAAVFATLENVVYEDGRFTVADPSWELSEPVPVETVLARVLRHFSVRLVAGGHDHPWPSGLDLDDITASLHGMAGHPAGEKLLFQGIRLEAEIKSELIGTADPSQDRLEVALARGDVAGMADRPHAYQELLASQALMAAELRSVHSRAKWAERKLVQTEKKLKQTRKTLGDVRGSATFKTVRALTSSAQKTQRVFKRR
jgi:hypothetical protein